MKNRKILLIGGTGNLGSKIIKSNIFNNLIAPKRQELDLLNPKKIEKILSKNQFHLIINCASIDRKSVV